MIHTIQSEHDARKILLDIVRDFRAVAPMVWELDEGVDYHDLPAAIYQCRLCDATTEQYPYERVTEECPRCGEETMELAIEVDMVVQGDTVLYRKGDL